MGFGLKKVLGSWCYCTKWIFGTSSPGLIVFSSWLGRMSVRAEGKGTVSGCVKVVVGWISGHSWRDWGPCHGDGVKKGVIGELR